MSGRRRRDRSPGRAVDVDRGQPGQPTCEIEEDREVGVAQQLLAFADPRQGDAQTGTVAEEVVAVAGASGVERRIRRRRRDDAHLRAGALPPAAPARVDRPAPRAQRVPPRCEAEGGGRGGSREIGEASGPPAVARSRASTRAAVASPGLSQRPEDAADAHALVGDPVDLIVALARPPAACRLAAASFRPASVRGTPE